MPSVIRTEVATLSNNGRSFIFSNLIYHNRLAMPPKTPVLLLILLQFVFTACKNNHTGQKPVMKDSTGSSTHTYAYDADFLSNHTKDLVELQNAEGAKVL